MKLSLDEIHQRDHDASNMFTLAHISDPHLGPLPRPKITQLLSKRILGFANWRLNRNSSHNNHFLNSLIQDLLEQKPQHIAVTGDLVNLALPIEFDSSRKWLELLGSPDQVSVIPGNHDAYVPGALANATNAWSAYMDIDGQSGIASFPFCRIRDRIAIIGLSSAFASAPFMATGKVDSNQLAKLKKILLETAERELFRVVLIHHPPQEQATSWHKRLVNSQDFRQVIRETGAELVLHGHTHENSLSKLEGNQGLVSVVGVPSASNAPGGHKPGARYNLIQIDRIGKNWDCWMTERGFAESGEGIVEIGSHNLLS